MKRMLDLNLKDQRVLMRVDFNVPVKDGKITSDARIRAALPGIQFAINSGAKLMLMTHIGRPKEGVYDEEFSLKIVADYLSDLIDKPVRLVHDWLDGVVVEPGEVVMCENVRFNVGEKKDDEALARKMAALCDVFVMDAFATSHRAQASTHGVAKFAKVACAGPLLTAEIDALTKALAAPARPLIAIVGGSKVSTKLTVLNNLCDKVDQLIIGGGIANTFLAAAGFPIGKSLYEADLIDEAKAVMAKIKDKGGNIPLPVDVVVAKEFAETAEATVKDVKDVAADDMILDIGPKSAKALVALLQKAATIVWNGPVGVFEFDQFGEGTKAVAKAIAESAAFSVAGGGDTLAAIAKYDIEDKVSYISTAGGAFLEFLEGKTLPAVAILEQRA